MSYQNLIIPPTQVRQDGKPLKNFRMLDFLDNQQAQQLLTDVRRTMPNAVMTSGVDGSFFEDQYGVEYQTETAPRLFYIKGTVSVRVPADSPGQPDVLKTFDILELAGRLVEAYTKRGQNWGYGDAGGELIGIGIVQKNDAVLRWSVDGKVSFA